jgi:effector-binding domain-containing protein
MPVHEPPHLSEHQPQRVLFLQSRGNSQRIPEAIIRLIGWAEQHGLPTNGRIGASFYIEPGAQLERADVEWEMWLTLPNTIAERPPAAPDRPGIKTLPAERVAAVVNKGPHEQAQDAYQALFSWLKERKLRPLGPIRELYISDPDKVPESEMLTEISVAI